MFCLVDGQLCFIIKLQIWKLKVGTYLCHTIFKSGIFFGIYSDPGFVEGKEHKEKRYSNEKMKTILHGKMPSYP